MAVEGGGSLAEFRSFRERMNDRILQSGNLEIKRFFASVGPWTSWTS